MIKIEDLKGEIHQIPSHIIEEVKMFIHNGTILGGILLTINSTKHLENRVDEISNTLITIDGFSCDGIKNINQFYSVSREQMSVIKRQIDSIYN